VSDHAALLLVVAIVFVAWRMPANGVHRVADSLERIAKALAKDKP
jgi:hypothetical protein